MTRAHSPAASIARILWPESVKVRVGMVIVICFVLLATVGPLLVHYPPQATGPDAMAPPSAEHWFGTTQLGEDVFSQFVYGARVSMLVGVIAALLSKAVAIVVGVVGGYFRGVTDEILYVLTAVFLVIPALPLLIVLTAYLPSRGVLTIAAVIAITSWPGSARIMRAQTMSLRRRDFVEAARATGESPWRIILFEIIPSELPLIASGFLFMIVSGILAEAGLSFLGLGNLTTVSWGSMLYFAESAQAFNAGAWWWFVPPGLAIAVIGAGLSLINFGIDEYANPRLRTGRRARQEPAPHPLAAAVAMAADPSTPPGGPEPTSGDSQLSHREKSRVDPDPATGTLPADAPQVIRELPPLPGPVIIEARHLVVDYPTDGGLVHAVRDVSLSLRRGEILGLAGESGSGKSTLTNAIARLLRPPAQVVGGAAIYHRRGDADGMDILTMSDEQLRAFRWTELAIVFQSAMNALNPVITIFAQFDDVLRVHRPKMTRAQRRALTGKMLEKVGIDVRRIDAYPHELSGGMKQRVAIALALVLDPEVIIMDEPTTALDLLVQREVIDQVLRLREEFGFAIIFTTHDLALLLEIADSVAVMRAGQIVEYGAADEVRLAPGHPYTRALLGSLAELGAKL